MELYKFDHHTLRLEKVKRGHMINIKVVLFSLAIFLILGFSSGMKITTVLERIPVIFQKKEEVACNKKTVKAYIKRLNLRFGKIVYQQAVVESHWFNSPLFMKFNNLMGMQPSTGRPTTGVTSGERFAKYESWKESLIDYALWQASYTTDIKTEEDYYYLLDKIYCEKDSSGFKYSDRLKQIPYEDGETE